MNLLYLEFCIPGMFSPADMNGILTNKQVVTEYRWI